VTRPGRGETARLAGLHVLADDDPRWKWSAVDQARAACAGGATVVQLRAKRATDREVLALCAAIREMAHAAGTLFFVNDRFDLALLGGADGVHLGQEDLPPARLPAEARARLLVGRSSHTLEQAAGAAREPVDYVAFGPLFGTTSKQSAYGARGLAWLHRAVEQVAPLPLVAIGGIDARGAREAIAAGARGVAVISAVADAADPQAATRELVDALREAAA
jgi:thiamine-phosphate pyrophosphorylase